MTSSLVLQLGNIQRGGCTALDVSGDGRHLATAGDKVIKIWDYYMRLDLNFQVRQGKNGKMMMEILLQWG
jgi:hypothetical protein